MKRPDRVVVYTGADGQWNWRLVAGNGRIRCTGESHPRLRDTLRAVRGVAKSFGTNPTIIVRS